MSSLDYLLFTRKTDIINMHKCVTHYSLRLQVSLVSNQDHGEVISVLHSQDLGVELLDLVIAVSHSINKQRFMWIPIYSKKSTGVCSTVTNLICSTQFYFPENNVLILCTVISCKTCKTSVKICM